MDLETPHGLARAHERAVPDARATLVLGHGAGGGFGAKDLVAATEVANAADVSVWLVEQPYRVAGRRSPAPAAQLDAAWIAALAQLPVRAPLIVGGRSAGARVACRTALTVGADAVLCLAFPLHPPGRPEKSRAAELNAVRQPTLVVQGRSDPFGMPRSASPHRKVVRVDGDHSLSAGIPALRKAMTDWMGQVAAG